ncbi:MAG: hypothetical protein E7273_06750 [Pseudobutyrivibrio ruminis]|nr:hypothetical protein [Pseudobutyrivibrio ruminis]
MNFLKDNKFTCGLDLFYRFMLLLFGVFEIGILWAMSIFFICYMASDETEITFFCKDNAVLNIVVVVIFIGILYFLKKRLVIAGFVEKLNDDEFFRKFKTISLRIMAIVGFFWVIITQYVPGSDQLEVMSCAYKYGEHITDMVEASGYLDDWPHNIGITTVERLLAIFVGDFNIVFMQLLNVAGIVIGYKKLVEAWDKVGGSRLSQAGTLICGIIFYPMIMYASFVYGNIWSTTFAIIAFDAELVFFEKKRNIDIAKCAIAIALSFIIKGSAMIYLVAIIIYAIVRGLVNNIKVGKVLLISIACCLSVTLFSVIPRTILIKTMGYDIRNDGIWAFIAMGLQEDGTTAGWYNGYCLDVYYDNNRDTEIAEQIAKEETFNRLQYLFEDKHNAYEFFSKKIASTWIEPTYSSYWISQVRYHRVDFPDWLDKFMTAQSYAVAAKLFNFFLILIFTGMALYLIFEDKSKFTNKSFLFLSVVGGFTFLLFWETKSQYTITYFIWLFPYAIEGFEMLLNKSTVLKDVKTGANKPIFIYLISIAVLYMVGYKMDASYCLSKDNAVYAVYLSQWQQPDTAESVWDINYLKNDLEVEKEKNENYVELLESYGK